MPKPGANETEQEFIARCIPIVLNEGTAQTNDQAVAICYSYWEQSEGEDRRMSKQAPAREYKSFPAFVTGTDDAQGIVETVFAVFGNVDQGNDVIHPGAFQKTLAERGLKVRVLDHHNSGSIMSVIGKPLEIRELARAELPDELLARFPQANGGAYAKVQLLMDTPEGKGAFIRLKEGAVDEWSFGYDALDVDYSRAMVGDKEVTVRNLRTLKLYEISPVIWGMNSATTTLGAKEADSAPKPEPASPVDVVLMRKTALVDALRAALAEAEALLTTTAPVEAGRVEELPIEAAGPADAQSEPPTTNNVAQLRAELLEQLSQLAAYEEA